MTNNDQISTNIADFIISGARAATTGDFPVFGLQNFSVFVEGTVSGSANANGTHVLRARVHPNASYTNLNTINFTNSSGVLYQFNGPFTHLQSAITSHTSGTFNVSICARG